MTALGAGFKPPKVASFSAEKAAQVNITKFQAMLVDLSKQTGRTLQDTLRGEVLAVMAQSMRDTALMSDASLRRNAESASKTWVRVNGKWMFHNWNWRDKRPDLREAVAAGVAKRERTRLEVGRKAKGLSRKQIALAVLGLNLPVVLGAKASGVFPPGWRSYVKAVAGSKYARGKQNVTTSKQETGWRAYYSFTIAYPLSRFKEVRLYTAIQKAIRGRVTFFKRNMKEGVFQSAQAIAGKYGAIVRRAA